MFSVLVVLLFSIYFVQRFDFQCWSPRQATQDCLVTIAKYFESNQCQAAVASYLFYTC